MLDNKTDEISRWYETAYRFVKRQSVGDPNRWVSVGDPRWTTQNTAAARIAADAGELGCRDAARCGRRRDQAAISRLT